MLVACITVGIVLAFTLVIIAAQPSQFRTERRALIAAPPGVVFGQVNDFRRWQNWSPWAKLDPAVKARFEGREDGVGSIFHWSGNKKVGAGNMTILDSRQGQYIKIRLEFFRPYKAVNTAEFTFARQGAATEVTWGTTGKNNFIGKALSLFMNYDKIVGDNLEKGLAQLNVVSRAEAAKLQSLASSVA